MTDPTVTEDDAKRASTIADIRAFADWLEANPWAPAPRHLRASVHLNGHGDPNPLMTLLKLHGLAERLDVKADESLTDRTRAIRNFGGVEYSLLAWHERGRPGQLDERDAELARLRAEVEQLRTAAATPAQLAAVAAKLRADQDAETGMVTRYFSFGHGHTDPATGARLANKYVTVIAPDAEACRTAMLASRFGRRWAFEYIPGRPETDEWIPRWTEHERIVVDEPSCQGAPAGFEADCGTPGPHGPHGPEPTYEPQFGEPGFPGCPGCGKTVGQHADGCAEDES